MNINQKNKGNKCRAYKSKTCGSNQVLKSKFLLTNLPTQGIQNINILLAYHEFQESPAYEIQILQTT